MKVYLLGASTHDGFIMSKYYGSEPAVYLDKHKCEKELERRSRIIGSDAYMEEFEVVDD